MICGGRDYDPIKVVAWLDENIKNKPEAIIHGCATGADTGAAMWASTKLVTQFSFPANWRKHGKAAGPIRNQSMIDHGEPTLVIAFPGGKGTADMVRRAHAARIKVLMVAD